MHSVTPMELKRSFSAKHRMYSDYNQQDAQEFLRFFLDSLHCALNTGVKGEALKIDDNLRYVKLYLHGAFVLYFKHFSCNAVTIKRPNLRGSGTAAWKTLSYVICLWAN